MKALFVELPAFAKNRADYLDDEGFRGLQQSMLKNPEAGDVIEGTGGLRNCVMEIRAEAKANEADCG